MNDRQKERIADLCRAGWAVEEIADELGLEELKVNEYLIEIGLL